MNIAELINAYENIIKESADYKDGGTAKRIAQMYIDIIFYLISNDKLTMSDNYNDFKFYITKFKPAELYKVAKHYRKVNMMPPLNYEQDYYQER